MAVLGHSASPEGSGCLEPRARDRVGVRVRRCVCVSVCTVPVCARTCEYEHCCMRVQSVTPAVAAGSGVLLPGRAPWPPPAGRAAHRLNAVLSFA